jgi:hypothetical protein
MIKRHDLDKQILDYLINSFIENNNIGDGKASISRYESTVNDITISIWKHQLMKKEKVVLSFHKNGVLKKDYEFSMKTSDFIRMFFEEIEDKMNQDYLRNNQKEILDLIS